MKSGFTLIELAIVIVIIGLITGGILGGQSLITSAKRQKIMDDLQSFETAINAFRLEYNAVPGDFDEAEDYWGASATDNGDGDKRIESDAEAIDLWNHLGLAGIIRGTYDHTATTLVAGTSTPETGEPYVYIIAHACDVMDCSGNTTWVKRNLDKPNPVATVGNFNRAESISNVDDYSTYTTGLTNKDVRALDQKFDNDNPLTGRIMAPACTMADKDLSGTGDLEDNDPSDLGSSYILTDDSRNCFFFYLLNTN